MDQRAEQGIAGDGPLLRENATQLGMASHDNLRRLREFLSAEAASRGLDWALGVSPFRGMYEALLPVQQRLLAELSGEDFNRLMEDGSIISIAYAFPKEAIGAIAVETADGFDMDRWLTYAGEYERLNSALDETAKRIAELVGGFALAATLEVEGGIDRAVDYYPVTVSHRVAAEQSGVGWRGRNELVVSPIHGCAIRLASVVTSLPLERTPPLQEDCGDCRACLDACPILTGKDGLENYRENCLRYMESLGLERSVCGKCVKACLDSLRIRASREVVDKP
jgi:epoxyqueuosine reductase QueG